MSIEQVFDLTNEWGVDHVAVGVVTASGDVHVRGDADEPYELASVTKPLVSYATLLAVEEASVSLDDPVGPPGSTLRHLLAHASGLAPDGRVMGEVGRRRVYSNAGFDLVGSHMAARTGMPVADYLRDGVLAPLGMDRTQLTGSPAFAAQGSLDDLLRFGRELLAPTLLAPLTVDMATSAAFPGLTGVLPGFGRQAPNDWGLGFELRGTKSPHWTATAGSSRTFGHFGGSGTFLWIDPDARVACACLTSRPFGPWAATAWPRFNDAVLAAFGGEPGD